jgi:hypothetical protein
MKNLRTVAALICVAFCGITASAQNPDHAPLNEPNRNKPSLFSNLPDQIPVSIDYLNTFFDSPSGKTFNLVTGTDRNSLSFEGRVISSESKYNDALKSVVVRSTNFNGATFTVSKYTDETGTVTYSGRIISMQHGDAYELKTIDGNLILVKRKFHCLINE